MTRKQYMRMKYVEFNKGENCLQAAVGLRVAYIFHCCIGKYILRQCLFSIILLKITVIDYSLLSIHSLYIQMAVVFSTMHTFPRHQHEILRCHKDVAPLNQAINPSALNIKTEGFMHENPTRGKEGE